jgi:hypothetical protein
MTATDLTTTPTAELRAQAVGILVEILAREISTSTSYEFSDTHRRIRNILQVCPAATWTQDESTAVLDTLSSIVRARQAVTR